MIKRRRTRIILVAIGIVVAAAGAGIYFSWMRCRPVDIEPAVSRFQANPCQATANSLIRLLDSGRVTASQAERILPLLSRPRVTTRSAYPPGHKPVVSVQHRFFMGFKRMLLTLDVYVCIGKERYCTARCDIGVLGTSPRLLVCAPAPQEPGRHKMEVEYNCSIAPRRRPHRPFPFNLLPWWNRPANTPVGRCSFTVPIELVVAEKEKAEKVAYISDNALDKAMRAAFVCHPLPGACSCLLGGGGITIFCNKLPANVAFEPVLQLSDGREIPATPPEQDFRSSYRAAYPRGLHLDARPIRLRAGRSDCFTVCPHTFRIQQPGQYDGYIALRPDPNLAYDDPAIKSIWDGELKFPISMTITSKN